MRAWERYLADRAPEALSDLKAFLAIPSISALPEHEQDVMRAAHWLTARLEQAGLSNVTLLPTGGAPFVYADWTGKKDAPTILVYGHYDVQPADPLDRWETPPFEPDVRNGRIYARGATDDKGNMLAPILAAEAMLATLGELPVNLKFLFEGQEEIFSPGLEDFLNAHRETLRCDLAVSADGWQWSAGESDLRVSLRGLAALDVTVETATTDVHSGMFGGAIPNATHALVQILAGLHDAEGRVRVEGFYDAVRSLSEDDRGDLAAIPHDDEGLRSRLGVEHLHGEAGFTTRERIGARPTLEINGLWGGFSGDGIKTIVPAQAGAKITCRLVADQRPIEIADAVARHIRRHAPTWCRVVVTELANGAKPYAIDKSHFGQQATRDVLLQLYGREPYYTRSGGSIPLLNALQQEIGVSTVVFGFGLPDENMHAPNEFLRLESFDRGKTAYGLLFERLGKR